MVDTLHCRTFADHVVLDVDVRQKAFVFIPEPLEMASVFDRHRSDTGDRSDELKMIPVEMIPGDGRVEINDAQLMIDHYQRHAHYGMRPRLDQTLGRKCRLRGWIVGYERHAVAQHLLGDGPADSDCFVFSVGAIKTKEDTRIERVVIRQKNRAPLRGDRKS